MIDLVLGNWCVIASRVYIVLISNVIGMIRLSSVRSHILKPQ